LQIANALTLTVLSEHVVSHGLSLLKRTVRRGAGAATTSSSRRRWSPRGSSSRSPSPRSTTTHRSSSGRGAAGGGAPRPPPRFSSSSAPPSTPTAPPRLQLLPPADLPPRSPCRCTSPTTMLARTTVRPLARAGHPPCGPATWPPRRSVPRRMRCPTSASGPLASAAVTPAPEEQVVPLRRCPSTS
jgi:hypothetical protein